MTLAPWPQVWLLWSYSLFSIVHNYVVGGRVKGMMREQTEQLTDTKIEPRKRACIIKRELRF